MTWTIESATARANAIQKRAEGLGLPDVRPRISVKHRFPKSPQVRAVVLSGTFCVWSTLEGGSEKFYDLALEVAAKAEASE